MMQLKKVLLSLLVAMMMLSLVVITASASGVASTTFDIALETSVSNVDADGAVHVKPGDTVEFTVVIENNPGVASVQIDLFYDADCLTPVVDDNGSVVISQGDTYVFKKIIPTIGKISFVTSLSSTVSEATGDAFSVEFIVADDCAGLTDVSVKALTFSATYSKVANNTDDQPVVLSFAASEHNFDFDDVQIKDPTCVEDGYEYVVCADEDCAEELIVKELPATPDVHNLEDATCTVAATCVDCGYVEGEPLDHSFTEYVSNEDATCTVDGTKTAKCDRCDVTDTVADEGSALGHTWIDATCVAPKTCSVCDATEGEALGHTEEVIPAVDATCTETGLTEGKKCSVCGEILVAQEEIPATGHTEEIVAGKAATCTETGLTEGKKCSVCGETTVAQEEIPATGHTEEVIPAVAATCTETGLTEGKKCSVCGETTVAQETVAALGHTWTDATCTDAKTCSVCNATEGEANGHTYTNDCDADCDVCGETRTPAAHAYGEWKVVTEATKKAEGKQEKTCSVCGNVESEVIPMVKGGCNSVMGALAVVAMTMVGAAVVIRKKED